MEEVILEMQHISKQFPGVLALDDCRFSLKKGEVHGLIGENGAGKSTLMKILCGVYQKDNGRVLLRGKEVSFGNTKQAMEQGICMIHQELNLMPHLLVYQNIFIGRETNGRGGFIARDRERIQETRELLKRLKLDLNPLAQVAGLTVAQQQMVEIVKAISYKSRILIMDEPTAALTEKEIDALFQIIQDLKSQGISVIYISHRMNELKQICDRITIMRDGKYIDCANMKDISVDEIISKMVGRTISGNIQNMEAPKHTPVLLKVENLTGARFRDVSFELRKGEILGVAGLMGAGRTEVARAVFGADPIKSGKIFLEGKEIKIRSTVDAVKHGIGYLSEDRKKFGLILQESVTDNTVLPNYHKLTGALGIVNRRQCRKETERYVDMLEIKTPGVSQIVKNLSGGNQQKVVIAKWLLRDCQILIFDEPTRGIDVGAKSEIYRLLKELSDQGKSILVISSELEEVLRISDRIVTMCEGRVTGVVNTNEASQEILMNYATAHLG
ncbi:MAG: sugar ABC transporter ATP-binding protein [Clostridium sp.]|nr:sugar ABC transporter ATP-binding protein [Clostridium sp.]